MDRKSLWIGQVQPHWDETYLHHLFSSFQVRHVQLVRRANHHAFGFLHFESHAAASLALQTMHGTCLPGTSLSLTLNWTGIARPRSLFVGHLDPLVTDTMLYTTFHTRFPSVLRARIVKTAGVSRGYGFVHFGWPEEYEEALATMSGVYCGMQPMHVDRAVRRGPLATVFVGGLNPAITEEALTTLFSTKGEVVDVTIPQSRDCAFVIYASRPMASRAISELHGQMLGSCLLRCEWGRRPSM